MEINSLSHYQLIELRSTITHRILFLEGLDVEETNMLMRSFNALTQATYNRFWHFPNIIPTIKAFRARTGLGLRESKEVVDTKCDAIIGAIWPNYVRL